MDKVLDLLERAGWTAGQQFLAVLFAGASVTTVSGLSELPWEVALGTAIGAGMVSVAATGLQLLTGWFTGMGFVGDLLTRLVKTFVASFVAAYVGEKVFNIFETSLSDFRAALEMAALTTILALGKGFLAGGGASRNATPSTLDFTKYSKATGPQVEPAP